VLAKLRNEANLISRVDRCAAMGDRSLHGFPGAAAITSGLRHVDGVESATRFIVTVILYSAFSRWVGTLVNLG
jgi:hypothetical protein